MSGNPEIEQSWWHVEDQLKPSKCRLFRQVMDFYAKTNFLEYDLPLSDGDILGLWVISRNKPGELAFIVDGHKLYVNLGDINSWPDEMIISGSKTTLRKHVKIEIKYMEQYTKSGTGFEFNKWRFWKGYRGYLVIELPIRPEFMITVPLGMEIEHRSKKLKLTLFRIHEDYGADANEGFKEISLKVEDPIVNKRDGKKVYTYVISKNGQDLIFETPENCSMILQATYFVKNENIFWGITVFAGILIFFTVVEVLRVLTIPKIDIGTPELSMLIALFSFTAFVLTLHRDNYEIPCRIFVNVSILFTIAGMVFILVTYLWRLNWMIIWAYL